VDKAQYNVRAVERSLDILGLYRNRNKPLSLTEISAQLGLNKTTSYRLLSTLLNKGYIHYDKETRKYTLGFEIFILGQCLSQSLNIRNIARPHLEKLSEKLGLISHLGVYDNDHVVILEKIFPVRKSSYEMISRVGAILPLHCTSLGKILISSKEDQEIREIMEEKGFFPYTDSTVLDIESFLEHIGEVRKLKYATDDCEHEQYIRCIAYPIYRARKREIVAAISVTGISEEVNNIDQKFLHETLHSTAMAISSSIV